MNRTNPHLTELVIDQSGALFPWLNWHNFRRVVAGVLFVATLVWWLWTDGPQGWWGFYAIIEEVAARSGTTLNAPDAIYVVLYIALTLIVNSTQLACVTAWNWFSVSRKRSWLFFPLFLALLVIPMSLIDIGMSAAGFYVMFLPITLDLSLINRALLGVSLFETLLGSIVAQFIVMVLIQERA